MIIIIKKKKRDKNEYNKPAKDKPHDTDRIMSTITEQTPRHLPSSA